MSSVKKTNRNCRRITSKSGPYSTVSEYAGRYGMPKCFQFGGELLAVMREGDMPDIVLMDIDLEGNVGD